MFCSRTQVLSISLLLISLPLQARGEESLQASARRARLVMKGQSDPVSPVPLHLLELKLNQRYFEAVSRINAAAIDLHQYQRPHLFNSAAEITMTEADQLNVGMTFSELKKRLDPSAREENLRYAIWQRKMELDEVEAEAAKMGIKLDKSRAPFTELGNCREFIQEASHADREKMAAIGSRLDQTRTALKTSMLEAKLQAELDARRLRALQTDHLQANRELQMAEHFYRQINDPVGREYVLHTLSSPEAALLSKHGMPKLTPREISKLPFDLRESMITHEIYRLNAQLSELEAAGMKKGIVLGSQPPSRVVQAIAQKDAEAMSALEAKIGAQIKSFHESILAERQLADAKFRSGGETADSAFAERALIPENTEYRHLDYTSAKLQIIADHNRAENDLKLAERSYQQIISPADHPTMKFTLTQGEVNYFNNHGLKLPSEQEILAMPEALRKGILTQEIYRLQAKATQLIPVGEKYDVSLIRRADSDFVKTISQTKPESMKSLETMLDLQLEQYKPNSLGGKTSNKTLLSRAEPGTSTFTPKSQAMSDSYGEDLPEMVHSAIRRARAEGRIYKPANPKPLPETIVTAPRAQSPVLPPLSSAATLSQSSILGDTERAVTMKTSLIPGLSRASAGTQAVVEIGGKVLLVAGVAVSAVDAHLAGRDAKKSGKSYLGAAGCTFVDDMAFNMCTTAITVARAPKSVYDGLTKLSQNPSLEGSVLWEKAHPKFQAPLDAIKESQEKARQQEIERVLASSAQ